MKELFSRYVRAEWKSVSFGLTIKLIGTVMDLFIPWTLAYIINKVTPTKDIRKIVLLGTAMIVMTVVALVLNILANRNANRVSKRIVTRMRSELFRSIMYLTRSRTDEFTVPSLISRVTSDSYHVHSMIGMMQRIGVRAPILVLGGLVVTVLTDPGLALVLLALQPLIFFTVYLISRKGLPLYTALQSQLDRIVLIMRENITGVRMIKALGKEEHERERFDKINRSLIDREKKSAQLMAMTNPLISLYLNIGLALVVLIGALRIQDGSTEIGTIVAFLSYFTMMINSMYAISRIFIVSTKGIASYRRISEVIHTKSDLEILDLPKEDTDYHIAFKNVSFSYYTNKNHLTGVDFGLKRGQTLGIIGPTGSGKTTIVKLLMRFYDVTSGAILISGRDVRSIPFEELYNMFGIVFQDDVLFADTIAENISLGRNIEAEDLAASIEMAQASEFIDRFEDKLNHHLTIRGSNLSGGQKQRLLISRALVANPEILILDDSSSALDYATDQRLRTSIRDHFTDSTRIIIAQRISSIKHSDMILFMSEGTVSGIGTHDELMKNNEEYRATCEAQLGDSGRFEKGNG